MAFTQAQLDALDEMIANGVLVSKYEDKEVRFDSFEQLVARRNFIARKLGLVDPSASTLNPATSKGMDSCE